MLFNSGQLVWQKLPLIDGLRANIVEPIAIVRVHFQIFFQDSLDCGPRSFKNIRCLALGQMDYFPKRGNHLSNYGLGSRSSLEI